MQTLGKGDHNEKIILLKSKGQRDPQAPRDSILHQLQDYNKRDITREREEWLGRLVRCVYLTVNHKRNRMAFQERT